ncbi:hypothetical protein Bequi_03515 [Brachybacterium sp. JHP9]|uniref:Uncharacterized protein n=1 Tax=Brachybacterium equifaecis TaxID=2910770 RepID=A0ABT0QXQ0_9MICO|nr:hypothetical protein [Brachybacterium equifaecis]MCL6422460.1 hypothetical protein [Brachybacterium equifaecis]
MPTSSTPARSGSSRASRTPAALRTRAVSGRSSAVAGVQELGRRDLVPVLLTAVLVMGLTLLPLLWSRTFYFIDDTAGGAYGQWYELGQELRAGHWPMLSLDAWMAGNHIAEGQWGLYNPVVWLISLAATVVPHPPVLAAIVKLAFLLLAGIGTYFLTRSYGVRPGYAVLAAMSAPVAGWTLYLDATAWVTNLEVWAYFPWVMWSARRFMYRSRGAVIGLAAGLLLVTVGYIQGTLMLIAMFLGLGVEALVRRQWGAFGRLIAFGVPMGLMAVTVYLPGLLTSDVTVREDTVKNTGTMTLTLNGLAVSTAPSGRADLTGWWGRYPNVPYTYIAWFLPLLLLASGRRMAAVVPRLLGAFVTLGIVMALAIGPSDLGPLRFPIRSMPWIALLLLVITAVVLSRGVDWTRVRRKLPLLVVATLLSFWLSYSAVLATWKVQIFWGVLCAVMLVGFGVLASRFPRSRWVVLALIGATAFTSALQIRAYVPEASHFGTGGFPTALEDYQGVVTTSGGEMVTVGDPQWLQEEGEDTWGETLWGSTWYLSGVPTMNAYSPTGYDAFNADQCQSPYYGATCGDLINRLFAPDETTGAVRADLFSLDTIQILENQEMSLARIERLEPPAGWSVADRDSISVTWVRDETTAPVGGPTWWTPGMDVEVLSQSTNEVTMRVDGVPAEGGRIVLSRLDWPGYRVSGGEVGKPLRDYLLTVDVPADSSGSVVTVTFRPPGWEIEMGALALSLLSSLALVALSVRKRGRRV